MNCEKIGKFIAILRKQKGLTQTELADRLNITDRAVSKWERGKGCPDISLLEDLSKILDVSIIELLKGEKINKKQKLEKQELIYSMNYAKESTKIKMYKILNNIIITLIFVVILFLSFNNLKIAILMNHHYYPNIMFIDGNIDSQNLFSDIEKKIELIKKDNSYKSKEDVNQIIDIIEKNFIEEEKIYNAEYYTFNDIKKLVYRDSNDMNNMTKLTINNIGKQNFNWNDDINSYIGTYYDYERNLKYFIDNCYKYNYFHNRDESIGNQVKQYLREKYSIYFMILDDILSGGEIDE